MGVATPDKPLPAALGRSSDSGRKRWAHRRDLLKPWTVAAVSTCAALGTDVVLGTAATEATDALYILSAAASAYWGRWAFGYLAIALALLPNLWFFSEPNYSLAIGAYGWQRVLVNVLIALVLTCLVGRLRQSQSRLRTLNAQLEKHAQLSSAAFDESNRQLAAFCYTLAHDLRAPLRSIQGFSQLTLIDNAHELSSDVKENLVRIASSAETMGRLVRDLLVYTELDQTEIKLSRTDLQQVIYDVLKILDPQIREKNAVVQIDNVLPSVSSNFVMLEQILLSLMSNALEFTRENVRPEVRIHSEQQRTIVRLLIEDNGVGIPANQLEKIFQPFQRLRTSAKPSGTGMGLAIAKKGITRLRGQIGVESNVERGSCFWIELPA